MEPNEQDEKEALNRYNNAESDHVDDDRENNPDPEMQNDTGYDGTTNAVSESRNTDEGYQIPPVQSA